MKDTRFAKFALWVNGGIPAALLTYDALAHKLGANPGNYALLTTGILAILFLTLSLAVTPVRKVTGWNALIFSRRTFGLLAFFHATAHVTLYFYDKQGWDFTAGVKEIWNAWYLLIGATAVLAMLPLALTSTNGMIRRLGAAKWKWLHRLAYVAGICGAVHFCLQGKFVKGWAWFYLGAIGVLLLFRVGMLIYHFSQPKAIAKAGGKAKYWSGQLRVAGMRQETPSVRTFRLEAVDDATRSHEVTKRHDQTQRRREAEDRREKINEPHADGKRYGQAEMEFPFEHLPGQYLNLVLMIGGKRVNRSYTIASSPNGKFCELTIKREEMGISSRHFHDMLKEGDVLQVGAPAGRFVFMGKEAEAVVLIAGGVGITPLMSMVRHLAEGGWGGDVYFLYSAKNMKEIIFGEELEGLKKRLPKLHLHITLSREESAMWTGRRGRIDAAFLRETVPEVEGKLCYVCGPDAMMAETVRVLKELGVPAEKIKQEVFVSGGAGEEVENATQARETLPQEVTFKRGGVTVTCAAGQTILEAGEAAGLALDFECRSGICGQCKKKCVSGAVVMEVEDALSAGDKAAGMILLCQAKPLEAVVVEA